MKVLVTGGTGFLGQAVVRRLQEEGATVRVLVRPGRALPAGTERVEGDLCSPALIEEAVDGTDAVVHAGARVATTGSWEEFRAVNVDATAALIRAASDRGVSQIVHVSSLSVYAVERDGACITEESPYEGQAGERGYYSRSKLEADRKAMEAAAAGLPVTVLRPGVLYGPGRRPPLGRQSVALRSLRLILGSPRYLLPLSYVDNVAEAVFAALRHPRAKGRAYTVVDPQIRLAEYLDLYRRIAGARWRVVFIPASPVARAAQAVAPLFRLLGRNAPISAHQVYRATRSALYDCTRAVRELEWAPRISLVEGLERSVGVSPKEESARPQWAVATHEST